MSGMGFHGIYNGGGNKEANRTSKKSARLAGSTLVDVGRSEHCQRVKE
jgi:hypothetical protein